VTVRTGNAPQELSDPAALSSESRSRTVRRARVAHRLKLYAPAVALLIGIFALWQLIAAIAGLQSFILPAPSTVVREAFAGDRTELLSAAGTTIQEVLIGFAAAVVCGFLLATLLVHSRIANRALSPLVIASQTIPTLAIAPVLIIWFGFGILPKVLVVTLFGFFPVAINTVAGMNSVDRDVMYLMRSLGSTRWEVFRWVRFPACLPSFFTGVKQAAVFSVIGAVTGEWVGGQAGLGPLMLAANTGLETALVFAAILYLSIMAIVMFVAVSLVERLVTPWHYIAKGGATRTS
jgi:putative hydroxymethylpyrimidine transport system permease protein